MKLILIKDVDRLGRIGDLITAKEGYARNFLLPKGLAKEATPQNMKMLEATRKKKALEEAKIVEEAKKLSEKIANLSLTIGSASGEEDKLYGSISNDDIAAALAEQGINIDKKDIILEEPIKKLGVYQAAVKLHPEVKASLRVWIVKK